MIPETTTLTSRMRRELLQGAAAASAIATLPVLAAGEPSPETKRIRLLRYAPDWNVACVAPTWVAEELLRAEGFDEVVYVPVVTVGSDIAILAAGQADMIQFDIFTILSALDVGKPVIALGGIHAGCYDLYGKSTLKSIRDMKGMTIAVGGPGHHAFMSVMLAYAGLDPRKDVTFLDSFDGVRLLSEGKVDAVLGFGNEPQIMREKKIGVSIVSTATDRPWSQYFCCMALGNRDFVTRHPVATKRALRALLKATDICAAEPERVARALTDRGLIADYESSARTLRALPYKRWREYDPADSLRFYALRLHEAGLIKSNPQKLLAQGTNWRFVEQLKKEMKA
jgi:NitT/TauT family transport system substrate-binding protein